MMISVSFLFHAESLWIENFSRGAMPVSFLHPAKRRMAIKTRAPAKENFILKD